MKRILQNLLFFPWQTRRAFPATAFKTIENAIAASEKTHSGELRFVVEGALDPAALWYGMTARQRAIDVFAQLRVWDTEENSGVLIYVLLAERRVEIVADRGIHRPCGAEAWEEICHAMEEEFRAGRFEAGAIRGIREIGAHLTRHFPGDGTRSNELSDRPVVL